MLARSARPHSSPTPERRRDELSRRAIALGAVATMLGIALTAMAPAFGEPSAALRAREAAGAVALFGGWAVLAWGIHRFGRDR